MTDAEITTALGGLNPNSPQWQAIQQLLQEQIFEEISQCANPNLNAEAHHFNCGRLSRAQDTATYFKTVMAEIHKQT